MYIQLLQKFEKKMFDYEANDEPINNPKDNFKITT
jgi:hypothetical protein